MPDLRPLDQEIQLIGICPRFIQCLQGRLDFACHSIPVCDAHPRPTLLPIVVRKLDPTPLPIVVRKLERSLKRRNRFLRAAKLT